MSCMIVNVEIDALYIDVCVDEGISFSDTTTTKVCEVSTHKITHYNAHTQ